MECCECTKYGTSFLMIYYKFYNETLAFPKQTTTFAVLIIINRTECRAVACILGAGIFYVRLFSINR